MNRQNQQGGDGTLNIQAGHDVVVHQGISVSDVKEIALDVFAANFVSLSQGAAELARMRAEELVEEFVSRLSKENAELLAAVGSPDIQASIYTAQYHYARSGRDSLKSVLVDLLVARCSVKDDSLQAIVLVEAIDTVRLLTPAGIAALTISWLIFDTYEPDISDHDSLRHWADSQLAPFVPSLPSSGNLEYRHLQYAGCITTTALPEGIPGAMLRLYPGLFQGGLTGAEVNAEIWNHVSSKNELFGRCTFDESKMQVAAVNEAEAREIAIAENLADSADIYAALLRQCSLSEPEIEGFLRELHPAFGKLMDVWHSTWLSVIHPTTVGMAIAHSNFISKVTEHLPLSSWIPDSGEPSS